MQRFHLTHACRILHALVLSAIALSALAARSAASAGIQQITPQQARSVALLVARHDAINVDDADTLVDSMDGNGPFVPGYFSFIVIAVDPHRPGKDRTLAEYAVSPRTGDTWELHLCKHYEFAALSRVQRTIRRQTGAHVGDDAAQPNSIVCEKTAESAGN